MANSASSRKRATQAFNRNKHNGQIRTRLRTFIKKTLRIIDAGEKSNADQAFRKAQALIDQAARKGLIHKNSAARKKSRIVAKIKNL